MKVIDTLVYRSLLIADDQLLTARLFIKLIAIVYFIAFVSMSVQVTGLVGHQGILPYTELLANIYHQYGFLGWFLQPTVFWFNSSDNALTLVTWAGCLLSVLLLFGYREKLILALLFILYLSIFHAGQIFFAFQWDSLLLEAGFLSIFLVGGPSRLLIFLFHWLLFRLRFMSGLSKLASGDPSWLNLTALDYYFQTQPLPHIGSWYYQQLPMWIHHSGVVFMFITELIIPLFIFLPRKFRLTAAGVTVFMQLLIISSSNHNWINILTIFLCLFLLDDRAVAYLLPANIIARVKARAQRELGTYHKINKILPVFAVLIIVASITMFTPRLIRHDLPEPAMFAARLVNAWGMGFDYHVFPTMQTERQELQVEGSYDGKIWKAYEFRYKPGPLSEAPRWNVPHQPRLDWMMWFVPPQFDSMMDWFWKFLDRLHEGSKDVTNLLAYNPFPARPPTYIRVLAFDYRFTTFAERKATGNWWKAKYLGEFPYVKRRYP